MAQGRLDRDQFFEKLAEMEATDLKKALWTRYWRGSAPLREPQTGCGDSISQLSLP